MGLEIWIPLAIWLAIGVAVAVYLYRRMDKEGKVKFGWLIVGFLLSTLGLTIYFFMLSLKEKRRDKAVDAKSYEAPSYTLKGEEGAPKKERPKEEKPLKKEVKQVEGIPRCPECGAAISSSDERCRDCGAKLK
ncbi:MAG: zinc ribbon domain-containing protein [Methanomassiliicoccales archaeon]|nr:zinc ribbon domain-containing protein [Methanomassiliicoccales archaeon]